MVLTDNFDNNDNDNNNDVNGTDIGIDNDSKRMPAGARCMWRKPQLAECVMYACLQTAHTWLLQQMQHVQWHAQLFR